MKPKEAIRILMLCPLYFLLSIRQRLELVKEYCSQFKDDPETPDPQK